MSGDFLKLEGCLEAGGRCEITSKYPIVDLSVDGVGCTEGKSVFTCPKDVFIKGERTTLQFITGMDASCWRSLTVFVEWTGFDRAIAVAEKINDAWYKSHVLTDIAKAMADTKLSDSQTVRVVCGTSH